MQLLSQNIYLIYCVYFPVYKNSFDNKIDFEKKKMYALHLVAILENHTFQFVYKLEIRKQLIKLKKLIEIFVD